MKKTINIPTKPLCLRKRAAALTIETAINSAAAENELSFVEIEEILYRYYVEAKRGSERDINLAESVYKQKVEEYYRQKAENEKEADDYVRNA